MKKEIVHCAFCGKEIDKQTAVIVGNRRYCCDESCHTKLIAKSKKKVHCAFCDNEIEKENALVISRKYFCTDTCFKEYEILHTETCRVCGKKLSGDIFIPPGKVKRKFCSEKCYQNSIEYVKDYWNDHAPVRAEINWDIAMQSFERLHNAYGFKYKGIVLTMRYAMEVLDVPILDELAILWQVPRYYQEAAAHWQSCREIAQLAAENESDEEVEVKYYTGQKERFKPHRMEDL